MMKLQGIATAESLLRTFIFTNYFKEKANIGNLDISVPQESCKWFPFPLDLGSIDQCQEVLVFVCLFIFII